MAVKKIIVIYKLPDEIKLHSPKQMIHNGVKQLVSVTVLINPELIQTMSFVLNSALNTV